MVIDCDRSSGKCDNMLFDNHLWLLNTHGILFFTQMIATILPLDLPKVQLFLFGVTKNLDGNFMGQTVIVFRQTHCSSASTSGRASVEACWQKNGNGQRKHLHMLACWHASPTRFQCTGTLQISHFEHCTWEMYSQSISLRSSTLQSKTTA